MIIIFNDSSIGDSVTGKFYFLLLVFAVEKWPEGLKHEMS